MKRKEKQVKGFCFLERNCSFSYILKLYITKKIIIKVKTQGHVFAAPKHSVMNVNNHQLEVISLVVNPNSLNAVCSTYWSKISFELSEGDVV